MAKKTYYYQKIDRSDFTLLPAGFGHYEVTYQSPTTGKRWTKVISNMMLIDEVKSENRTKRALKDLRRIVKEGGHK